MPIGGDPHIERIDGLAFDFHGIPGQRYNVYTKDDFRVCGRVSPVADDSGRTFLCGVDVYADDTQVYIGTDGWIHIFHDGRQTKIQIKYCSLDAPGHFGCTQADAHPLQGIAHINLDIVHPEGCDHTGATGLLVDGTAENGETHGVAG